MSTHYDLSMGINIVVKRQKITTWANKEDYVTSDHLCLILIITTSNKSLYTTLVLEEVFKLEFVIKELNLKCLFGQNLGKFWPVPEGLPATLYCLSLPEVTAGFRVIRFTISRQINTVLKQKGNVMQSCLWLYWQTLSSVSLTKNFKNKLNFSKQK